MQRSRGHSGSTGGSSRRQSDLGVTPPVRGAGTEKVHSLARLLDAAVRIPGTNIRFGLDALIGLFPGVGDVTGAALSGYIVLAAAQLGVPPAVLTRMLLNLGVDALAGTIPLLGDLFDIGFRANLRNAALLERYAGGPGAVRKSSRLALALAVGGIVLLAAGGLALTVLAFRALNWLAGAG